MNHEDELHAEYMHTPETSRHLVAEKLYRALYRHALAVIYGLTRHAHPDLAHRIVAKAFATQHTFQQRSSFHTWFHSVAKNEVLMWLRDKQGSAEVSLEDLGEVADAQDKIHTPLVLKEVVEKLPERERDLLTRKLDGYTDAEIAQQLNLTRTGVGVKWLRLKKKLREQLT